MAIAPGRKLGIYEIREPLGSGAMGQVYLARDTTLDRDVAIKVLPEDFAADEERLHRFRREAKSLASLNHSNIAQIYAVDKIDGTNFLSLEFVPGETLDERLSRGPLPFEEALRVCRDIAEGLEAAHEAGVIHRDLKPANVRVTPDGTAKVLDFGLAKPMGGGLLETSPKSALTRDDGRLLGTPTYMAPEQIGGKEVDRRIDIWAFGCVLYECLSGRRAFDAESMGSLFAAIAAEPIDLDQLKGVPGSVRRLLERCLRKVPRERLRDIGDARVILEDVLAGRGEYEGTDVPPAARSPLAWLAVMFALVAGVLIGWALVPAEKLTPTGTARYSIILPRSESLVMDSPTGSAPPLTISPDGRTFVIAARDATGKRRIYRRKATDAAFERLPDTEGVDYPIFSEEGEHLIFTSLGAKDVYRLASDGSVAKIRERTAVVRGISWGPGNRIVYADQDRGLVLRSLANGDEKLLTEPGEDEFNHRWPQFLPGGDRLLYTAYLKDGRRFQPRVLSLESGESVPIPDLYGAFAKYLPADGDDGTGFFLYMRGNDLWAVRIDVRAVKTLGKPAAMVSGIHVSQLGIPHVAIARSGVLVYEPKRPPSPGRRLLWVDRNGKESELWKGKGFEFPRLSPKGSKVVFAHHTAMGIHEVWTLDFGVTPKSETKVDTKLGNAVQPLWSPEGDGLAFSDFRGRNIWIKQPLKSAPTCAKRRPGWQLPGDWNRSGRLLFQELTPDKDWDIVEIDLEKKDHPPRTLLSTEASETAPVLSPNGRWLAYVSEETGRAEVFVRSYDLREPLGSAIKVSEGTEPVWSKDGRELFFRRGNAFFATRISDKTGRRESEPEKLFEGPYVPGFNQVPNYDVSADGRFVVVEGGWGLTAGRLDVHLNFRQELEKALPRSDR